MLSPHETFTKATHLILFLRAEDWLSRFYAARVISRPHRALKKRSAFPVRAENLIRARYALSDGPQ